MISVKLFLLKGLCCFFFAPHIRILLAYIQMLGYWITVLLLLRYLLAAFGSYRRFCFMFVYFPMQAENDARNRCSRELCSS